MKSINQFQRKYRWLSNFWPCYLVYHEIQYPTVEHAYQAAKVESLYLKTKIKNCPTPAEAKDFFETHEIKPDPGWAIAKKLRIMEELLRIKFSGREPFLTRLLLETGDADLVEGNTWNDIFWGVCNGSGENNLGKLLMKVREELNQQKQLIISQLKSAANNAAVAETLSISQRELYEKMIAFKVKNKEYWMS